MKLNQRTKRRLRRVGYVAAIVVVYCISHLLLMEVYPDPLFRYSLTHRNFTVHMREPVPHEITRVLDRVHSLLSASPLNDETLKHDIYIINSYRLSRYLFLKDVGFGANAQLGNTFIVNADPANDIARCDQHGPDDQRIRTLSGTIAHEITHALIRRHVGLWAARRIPYWLKEGYCDVVGDGSAINEREGLALVESGSWAFKPGIAYFRYRLVVDYLLNGKHITIDELIQDPPNFGAILAEIRAGLRKDGPDFLRRMGLNMNDEGS
ncbi:MAG: hypothetical protein GY774_03990 [Planctomycetes bacterium]|nr:hypothetical protein [Planctomycetota bacterium]